eukprot:1238016-Amphidinium_carterae.1
MASTAGVSSVSTWSKVYEPRRKPKAPGRYVFHPSTNYHHLSHSGNSDEDVDSVIEAFEQDRDDDVKRAPGRRNSPCPKAVPRPSKAPVEEREGPGRRKGTYEGNFRFQRDSGSKSLELAEKERTVQ